MSLNQINTFIEGCGSGFIDPDAENSTCMSDQELIALANGIGYKYVAPVIFAIGLLGNVANIVVLQNTKRFSGRLYIYLRALALTDIICLSFAVSGIIHQMAVPFHDDGIIIGTSVQVNRLEIVTLKILYIRFSVIIFLICMSIFAYF